MCPQISSVRGTDSHCSIVAGLRHFSYRELACAIRQYGHLVRGGISLAAYDSCQEAQEAQAALAERGIVSEISEKTALEYLWLVFRPRANIQLRVRTEDYGAALQGLRAKQEVPGKGVRAVACPDCGSFRVTYPQYAEESILPNIVGGIAAGIGLIERRYFCEHCHYSWSPQETGLRDQGEN